MDNDNIIPKLDKTKTVSHITMKERQRYMLSCHNSDYAMGCHYPEDDWDIIAYGDTLDELYESFAPIFFGDNQHGEKIAPSSWEFDICKTIEYTNDKGETFKTTNSCSNKYSVYSQDKEQQRLNDKIKSKVVDGFLNSSYHKDEQKKYQKRQENLKKQKKQKYKKDKEDKERKELERLQNKYNPDK